MDSPREEAAFRPLMDNRFHFACHREIPCFTQCCARLRLILAPYDILRMKRRLGLSSDQFLTEHTETVIDPHHRFPMVQLKMNRETKGACPFVSSEGCTIYEDRPEACRLYPIGRASAMADGAREAQEKFFMVAESHCLGFREKKAWTLEEWLDHEGVKKYAAMNDPWRGIVTSARSLGPTAHIEKKHQMFFMASYNLDRFRDFLFNSGFFDRFQIDSGLKEELGRDDVTLMRFAFDWLRFSLFGEKTIRMNG
ncbi:MAG: YkgJ family cysteine cluster protein [Thermodesulfobacteriota bacterium]|nr:YkgJ family cysteine cluster protein [Thermodesulfobacteriota bacterium]